MSQGSLSDTFSKVKDDLQKSGSHFNRSLKGLKVVRDVVQRLRDSGYDAALEVRPAGYKSPVQNLSDAIVNGTLTMDGTEVEFVFEKEGNNSYQYFRAYVGDTRIENHRFRVEDADWLSSTVTRMLLGVKAQNELLVEFNIGANNQTRNMKLDKSVLPKPPKLKAGP